MATFVLIHGGSHGGWCWRKLGKLLANDGHDVHTPTLTGMGERVHLLHEGVDLDVHIEDVMALIQFEDLHDVILVGHSYGGAVVTGVADRAPDRMAGLVYLDAVIPVDGDSVLDNRPDRAAALRAKSMTVNGAEVIGQYGDWEGPICGVTDPEDLAWMRPRMTFTPWKCIAQPLRLSNQEVLDRLPRANINTTKRLKSLYPEPRERALHADRVWEIDTGHDVMITRPKEVADMLLEFARSLD